MQSAARHRPRRPGRPPSRCAAAPLEYAQPRPCYRSGPPTYRQGEAGVGAGCGGGGLACSAPAAGRSGAHCGPLPWASAAQRSTAQHSTARVPPSTLSPQDLVHVKQDAGATVEVTVPPHSHAAAEAKCGGAVGAHHLVAALGLLGGRRAGRRWSARGVPREARSTQEGCGRSCNAWWHGAAEKRAGKATPAMRRLPHGRSGGRWRGAHWVAPSQWRPSTAGSA